jgi:hypothetical protein
MAGAGIRRLLCAAAGFAAAAAAWARTTLPAPVTAEPLPDPHIAGFRFPEDEATLAQWIATLSRGEPAAAAGAFEKIHLHAWGLWTAVTAETRQAVAGQRLRVFETWATPDDLATGAPEAGRQRAPLRALVRQKFSAEPAEADAGLADTAPAARVLGFTKFDPVAAAHIARHGLLQAATLDALRAAGEPQVPVFPPAALAIKPLFQVITAASLVAGRYYPLKAWPGPPDAPRVWGPAQWPGVVWLDVFGGGRGAGAIDGVAAPDGRSRTDETTYPLARLIHYALTAADAAAVNADKPGTGAAAGDYAILVAMHVSTREIARWTWQTFWWTPAPDAPPAPSSADIAALRPAQLRGPARNYALTLAYTMVAPDQPPSGGENAGLAVYAYNPWIETRLAPGDLPDSLPGFAPDGTPAANNFGTQTNCMSCHARANYNPLKLPFAPRFSGARYVDLMDPQFAGTLQVDFLWSLARHAK